MAGSAHVCILSFWLSVSNQEPLLWTHDVQLLLFADAATHPLERIVLRLQSDAHRGEGDREQGEGEGAVGEEDGGLREGMVIGVPNGDEIGVKSAIGSCNRPPHSQLLDVQTQNKMTRSCIDLRTKQKDCSFYWDCFYVPVELCCVGSLSMQVSKCLIQRSLANRRLINVIRSPSLCRVYVGTASQWLEQLQVQVPVGTSPMSTSIIHHADSLHHQHWPGSYEGMDRDSGSAGAPPTPATPPTPSAVTSSILLREQELAVPSTFSVAPQTSVPVHQLVAVFSSLLGSPKLPKDARASSMAVKWRLLQLLLLQHAGDREAFADSLQQLLEVMLSDTVRRLGKVRTILFGHGTWNLTQQQRVTAVNLSVFNQRAVNITSAACAD